MEGPRHVQPGSHCHRKTWINILLGILQLLLPCVQHGGAQLQALTQMSNVVEVWQAEDVDLLVPTQTEEEQNGESLTQKESSSFYLQESGRRLRFQPPSLEFGSQPLGLPRAETISIHNPSQDLSVTLLSMFTSSRHFHMPSFHKRVIPPRGKTSFKLLFLPTEEGNVENSLFINTSTHGVLSYQVFGVGVRRGSSLDAGEGDSVLIFPHIQSIKLTQTQEDSSNITILGLLLDCSLPKSVYSRPQESCFVTDGKLSLQISLSERGMKPADLDKLKPYVIENILVLLVVPAPGSDTWQPKINVYMLNSGDKKLYLKDVQLLSKGENSLEFNQVLLRTSATNFSQVASLTCKGTLPANGKRCSSQISLLIYGNRTVKTYPWLTRGRAMYDLPSLVQIRHKLRRAGQVDLWLSNSFSVTVREVTVSRETQGSLKVMNYTGPMTLPSGCWKLCTLQLANKTRPLNLVAAVTVATDVGISLEVPLHIRSSMTKQGGATFDQDEECGRACPVSLSEAGSRLWQQSLRPESPTSCWNVDSRLTTELHAHWRNPKDQLSCRWPRLPAKNTGVLDFGATPVNESKVKYLTLKNPSASALSVELRALSSYPAPLEALDLLTKWFSISPLSVNISTKEFTLLPAGPKVNEGVMVQGEGVLRLLLQPWETKEVAVVFTPTEHKPVTSLLLIRNNLTVLDMVMIKGHGARELLRVGGKLPGPGASLRFNVPQSTLMECRDGLRSSKPLFAISKSFKVENAGELPLTVTSMNINGYPCQGFGFEVLQCRSFSLSHNTSSEITIAFTPDFTSSWVIRDLTLVTSRGSSFPFTLNVTLPHHMLPLCAQVVPGPSWEERFWVVTLVFACFSLAGVCLMAFHQAQYILSEFSTPSSRTNHNSPRDNGGANHVAANGANRLKGSCKSFVDTCHTSDKGKGKGSSTVASPPVRPHHSSKKTSGTPPQPQKKHKVSVYYGKYRSNTAAPSSTTPAEEEEREDQMTLDLCPEPDVDVCNNNNGEGKYDEMLEGSVREAPPGAEEEKGSPVAMFPVETRLCFPENVTVGPGPRPGPPLCIPAPTQSPNTEKRDGAGFETREDSGTLKQKPEKAEPTAIAPNHKGKKSLGKIRRKIAQAVTGCVPEPIVVGGADRTTDAEWRDSRTGTRTRNRCANGKPEAPKAGPNVDSLPKQNGVCMSRSRRKGVERRPPWESGSDSGSSSGSVRASRGSWSSTSSVEGDKEHGGNRHHCTTSVEPTQYSGHPAARDCYQTANSSYKSQSVNHMYRKEPCPVPEPLCPAPSFPAGAPERDRSVDVAYLYSDQTWTAPSVPLTNEFRYNTTEPIPYLPQGPNPASYAGLQWSSINNPYTYCYQSKYVPGGNANFQNSFPSQESPTPAYSSQPSWSEECSQDTPSSWDQAACVGSKQYFSGTRSLSPMSSLFGSIWTPQSEPYQSHFQPEPPVPVSPPAPFSREPGGLCRPKQYSGFNPFGPHMNLDIWNSSSNRSSNSQLSNDSGYCGDV